MKRLTLRSWLWTGARCSRRGWLALVLLALMLGMGASMVSQQAQQPVQAAPAAQLTTPDSATRVVADAAAEVAADESRQVPGGVPAQRSYSLADLPSFADLDAQRYVLDYPYPQPPMWYAAARRDELQERRISRGEHGEEHWLLVQRADGAYPFIRVV